MHRVSAVCTVRMGLHGMTPRAARFVSVQKDRTAGLTPTARFPVNMDSESMPRFVMKIQIKVLNKLNKN